MIRFQKLVKPRKQIGIETLLGSPVIGGVVSGIASLFGGKSSSDKNLQAVRETNAQQMRMFQQQLDYNRAAEDRARQYALQDFSMQNQYNHPAAQMQRYRDAGLNPALMMQGQNAAIGQIDATSAASSAPAAPQLGAPTVEDYISPALDRVIQGMVGITQAEKTANEAAGVASDNRVKVATERERIVQQKYENDLRIAQVRSMKLDPKIKRLQVQNMKKQNEILDDTLAQLDVTFDSRSKSQGITNYLNDRLAAKANQEMISQEIMNQYAHQREQLNLKMSDSQVKNLIASAIQARSQAGLNVKMAAYTALQSNNIDPKSKEGYRAQRFLESQITKNLTIDGVTGTRHYNPYSGKYELVPVDTRRVLGFDRERGTSRW